MNKIKRPRIIIIAGPNGAGKTTFAREFLPKEAYCPVFINADLIAAGISPFAPESASISAGRIMLQTIYQFTKEHKNFAFETTLSGITYIEKINQWQNLGYQVKLIFLKLNDVDQAIERVALRVKQGGHNIPNHVIRRRFIQGWQNFETRYQPLVDSWAVYDATSLPPRLIEIGENR